MLDQILAVAVVFLPVVMSMLFLLVPSQSENRKQHMRWRFALFAVAIGFGGISWWQEVRATRAATKDRVEAIKETSQSVAAETSKQVTQAVTEKYQQLVAEQRQEIGELRNQLTAQGADVSLIKSSNIVTGKHPVKVEVTNPSLRLPNLSWTQEQNESYEGKATMTVHFSVDDYLPLPGFLAVCDRPCRVLVAAAGPVSQAARFLQYQPSEVGVVFGTPKPLSPGTACDLRLSSFDTPPVKVLKFRILKESEIDIGLK